MLSLINPHDEHAEGVILNNAYETHATVNLLGNLSQSNMHDFTVADDGATALTLMNDRGPSTLSQSRLIGFNGTCNAGWEGFKEIRVADGSVLFSWRARDWLGLDESQFIPKPLIDRCTNSWDILHLNSIDKFPDGDYLLSSRHMNALYKISHVDGHIVWRLGGAKSDFPLSGPLVFSRQHHARVYAQNATHTLISVFDNAAGSGPPAAENHTNTLSRGLLIALHTSSSSSSSPRTAELLAHYDHPKALLTNSRGSISFLPNGNVFMGWTYASRQSEHDANGTVLMEAKFRLATAHSYRNYKFPWVGRPRAPPDVYSVAVSETSITQDANETETSVSTIVYVSWNGATEVSKWAVYRSTRDGRRREVVAVVAKDGFETAVSFEGYAAYVVVEARDERGGVLEFGVSEPCRTSLPVEMEGWDVATELQWQQQQQQEEGDEDGSTDDVGGHAAGHEVAPAPLDGDGNENHEVEVEVEEEETAPRTPWPHLPPLLGSSPILLFLSGFVCSAILGCATTTCMARRSRTSKSWWRAGRAGWAGCGVLDGDEEVQQRPRREAHIDGNEDFEGDGGDDDDDGEDLDHRVGGGEGRKEEGEVEEEKERLLGDDARGGGRTGM